MGAAVDMNPMAPNRCRMPQDQSHAGECRRAMAPSNAGQNARQSETEWNGYSYGLGRET